MLNRIICKINFELSPNTPPYETYFKKPDLEFAKNKFMKIYNDELKHYGYVVD